MCAVLLPNGIQHYQIHIKSTVEHLRWSFKKVSQKSSIVDTRLDSK